MSAPPQRTSAGEGPPPHLPDHVRRILPPDTATAWLTLAPSFPKQLHLGGGTAVAVHLGHRESRDLDFFFYQVMDLSGLRDLISGLGAFAVTHESEGTLKGLFGATKLEIFDASELKQLAKPVSIGGLNVAGLQDLMAMKIKVMAERGEMRDYFDVKAMDENGAVSIEEGIELYMERYGIDHSSEALSHLYMAMGDLSDVEVDEALPAGLDDLQDWWGKRQAQVLRNSSRFG